MYGAEWSTPGDAYVTIGLAHCFEKGDDGKLADRFVIEPITANSLECMANGGWAAGRAARRRGVQAGSWMRLYGAAGVEVRAQRQWGGACVVRELECEAGARPPCVLWQQRRWPPVRRLHLDGRPTPALCPAPPAGAKTCFKHVYSCSLEEALAKDRSALPPEFAAGVFCENFEARADACARTWMRPHALDNLL